MPPKRKARPKRSAFVTRKRQKWEEERKTTTPMSRSNAMALWRVVTEKCADLDEFVKVHHELTETRESIVHTRDALLAKLPSFSVDVFAIIIQYADPGERNPVQTKFGGPVLGRLLKVGMYDENAPHAWDRPVETYNERKSSTNGCFDMTFASACLNHAFVLKYLTRFVSKLEDSVLPEAHDFRVQFPSGALAVDPLIVFRTPAKTSRTLVPRTQPIGFRVDIGPLFATVDADTGIDNRVRVDLDEPGMEPSTRTWSSKLPGSINEFLATIRERLSSQTVVLHNDAVSATPAKDPYSQTLWFTLEQIARLSPALDFPF